MQTHGPKRVYTPKSLEYWFGKFEEDWATHFSQEELDLGRQIYREGAVREVELGEQDAIIHRRVEKRDEYAVIEWEEMKPIVRSSSTDVLWAHALAVAGLHEIEELVADEISPVPADLTDTGDGNGNGEKPKRKEIVRDPTARRFVLCLKASPEGLLCEAFWEEGSTRLLAYGGTAQSLTAAERSKMIGLATYARKAHFKFSQETHAYVLEAVGEIPEFLKSSLPVWEKHFAVEIDPTIKNLQQGVRQVEVEAHAGRSSTRGGINMRWVFRAGEKMLTETEVRAISARHGQQVILPHVGIVTLSSEKWESVENWKRTVEDYHGGALPPFLIFSLFNDARWKVTLTPEIEAWRKKVLGTPSPPTGLLELLRPYQRKGVEWINHLAESDCHGLLADEMGLGKTIQVLSLLAARPMNGSRHVIVCPASVVPVWIEEAARFFPSLKLDVLKAGHDFITNPEPVIWLASYTQLRKHRALLDKSEFGYAILDEGQFIKNPDAKVTKACFAIRAAHRLVLTGTPLENRQLDLWSIFRFLLPGLLGSRGTFEASLLKDREDTIKRLRLQITPFVLRRTKDEVAKELPPKVVMDLHCPLTEVQRAEYGKICEEGMQRLGSDLGAAMRDRSFGFFALLTRLRQACCDPDLLPWMKSDVSQSGKLNLLVEKLGEVISSGHKVVIFSQFVMFLDRVREVLGREFPDIPKFELTGVTLDRQKPVQGFQSVEGPAVILVSLKAAGTGITLHAADYVFLMDPWWNPAVEDQAVDRVHRIGQTNTVFVYRLVTEGTIEERIQALKAEKRALFDQIVGNFKADFNISEHFTSLESLIRLAAVPEPENGDGDGDTNGD